jgi:hypothetical protein
VLICSDDSSWDFPDVTVLPTLEEGPDPQDADAMSAHIVRQWKDIVQSVEGLKTLAGRNNRYEKEIESLSTDIDALRAAMARVNDLVGRPANGVAFDLFAIIDGNEEALLDLDTIVQTTITPQLKELDARSTKAQLELDKFKASSGDALLFRLAALESQIRAVESSSTPDALSDIVVQIRTSLLRDIFPAIRHLWKLYELTTVGTDKSCDPNGTHPTGAVLVTRLEQLETSGRNLVSRVVNLESADVSPGFTPGAGGSSLIGLTQRVSQLEKTLVATPAGAADPRGLLPDLFGQPRGDAGTSWGQRKSSHHRI